MEFIVYAVLCLQECEPLGHKVARWASIEECREKETFALRSHIAGQLLERGLSPEQVADRVSRFVAVCRVGGDNV